MEEGEEVYQACHSVHHEDRIHHHKCGTWLLVSVLDGHGGSDAVTCLHASITPLFEEIVVGTNQSDSVILETLFARLATRVADKTSGAAVTMWLLNTETRRWTCANVGDVLGVHILPTTHTLISTSHRLQCNPEERSRVLRDGGRIEQSRDDRGVSMGVIRLWPGGLAMSRSLGDLDVSHRSTTPSLSFGTFDPTAESIVIASDGVYDHLSVEQIVSLIRTGRSPQSVIDRVVRSGCNDDASIVIIRAPEIPSLRGCVPFFRKSPTSSPTVTPTSSSTALDTMAAEAHSLPVSLSFVTSGTKLEV